MLALRLHQLYHLFMIDLEYSTSLKCRQDATDLLNGQLDTVQSDLAQYPEVIVKWLVYFAKLQQKYRHTRGREIMSGMGRRVMQLSEFPETTHSGSIVHAANYGVTFGTELLMLAAKSRGYDWQDTYALCAAQSQHSNPMYSTSMSVPERHIAYKDHLRAKCERGLVSVAAYGTFLEPAHIKTPTSRPITEGSLEREVFDLSLGLTFDTAIDTLTELRQQEIKTWRSSKAITN
jgi:hypothetical protein